VQHSGAGEIAKRSLNRPGTESAGGFGLRESALDDFRVSASAVTPAVTPDRIACISDRRFMTDSDSDGDIENSINLNFRVNTISDSEPDRPDPGPGTATEAT
jgi:hypothetical protein